MPPSAAELVGARVVAARTALDAAAVVSVRWVPSSSYHLTVRFLGPVPPERLAAAAAAVGDAASEVGPFELALGGVHPLGGGRAGALVCEVGEGGEPARALERRLSDALAARGWPREPRAFRPHLTIGRAGRRGDPRTAFAAIASADPGAGVHWNATEIVLFESVRDGAGPPRYERRAEAPLGA